MRSSDRPRVFFRLLAALAATLLATATLAACDDDGGDGDGDADLAADTGGDTGGDTAPDTEDDTAPDTDDDTTDTAEDTTDTAGDTDDTDMTPGPTRFTVTLENLTDRGPLPSPFAPAVYAVHDASMSLFAPGEAAPEGLESAAEDGSPAALRAALEAAGLPVVGALDAPVMPGAMASFSFETDDPDAHLSLASMFGQSNDWFLSPAPGGIALFDANGDPVTGEVELALALWDAGTERDQLPYFGLDQAPRQAAPNTGPAEGVVAPWHDTTRAVPVGAQMASIDVTESGGTFTVTISNIGRATGMLSSPLSPVLWAVHDDTATLFTTGEAAPEGIERIAEDGNPTVLLAAVEGMTGVEASGVANIRDGGDTPGPIVDGQSYTFEVTPTATARFLSIASMVGQSNDTFIAFGPEGLALLDESGAPRTADAIEADIFYALKLWDAGTEVNEPIGVGPNQAPRQGTPDTGADESGVVHVYDDITNDLDDATAPLGGLITVTVADGTLPGTLDVSLARADDGLGVLVSPAFVQLHDGTVALFEEDMPASPGLEALAEDGSPTLLVTELGGGLPQGTAPIGAGESIDFTLTPLPGQTHLNLASMVAPSNDTFLALGTLGVAIRDTDGNLRAAADIQTDLDAALGAWEAGTERNQASMAGPDMAGPGLQAGPDTGAAEGDGTVAEQATAEQIAPLYRLTIAVE